MKAVAAFLLEDSVLDLDSSSRFHDWTMILLESRLRGFRVNTVTRKLEPSRKQVAMNPTVM
jgi:hypothetical protein